MKNTLVRNAFVLVTLASSFSAQAFECVKKDDPSALVISGTLSEKNVSNIVIHDPDTAYQLNADSVTQKWDNVDRPYAFKNSMYLVNLGDPTGEHLLSWHRDRDGYYNRPDEYLGMKCRVYSIYPELGETHEFFDYTPTFAVENDAVSKSEFRAEILFAYDPFIMDESEHRVFLGKLICHQ